MPDNAPDKTPDNAPDNAAGAGPPTDSRSGGNRGCAG